MPAAASAQHIPQQACETATATATQLAEDWVFEEESRATVAARAARRAREEVAKAREALFYITNGDASPGWGITPGPWEAGKAKTARMAADVE